MDARIRTQIQGLSKKLATMNIYVVIKTKRMDEITEGENIAREKFYNAPTRSSNN